MESLSHGVGIMTDILWSIHINLIDELLGNVVASALDKNFDGVDQVFVNPDLTVGDHVGPILRPRVIRSVERIGQLLVHDDHYLASFAVASATFEAVALSSRELAASNCLLDHVIDRGVRIACLFTAVKEDLGSLRERLVHVIADPN